MLKYVRPKGLTYFKKYLKQNNYKFPKLPKVGEIWISKSDYLSEFEVTGLRKVRDSYMLAMEYSGHHLDSIIVFFNHLCDFGAEGGAQLTGRIEPLDNFILHHEFFKKIF